jgi:hypothetical protein
VLPPAGVAKQKLRPVLGAAAPIGELRLFVTHAQAPGGLVSSFRQACVLFQTRKALAKIFDFIGECNGVG